MEIGKSKILYISLVYTAVEWIVALLNRFNSGTNDTYSLIVFGTYLVLLFGMYAMYAIVVISFIVTFVKSRRDSGDKTLIKPCIINSIISIIAISTLFLTPYVLDFTF